MINNSHTSNTDREFSQGSSPLKDKIASSPIGKTKLKQYGKKSLTPLVDLLHKYKDQINPYMLALDKGLEGACNSFSSSSSSSFSTSQQESTTPNWKSSPDGTSKSTPSMSSSVSQSNPEAEQIVAGWFREATDWFKGARDKMSTEDPKDLLNYLEEQAKARPGLMFATSYVAGLVFGRLGRHIGRIKTKNSMQTNLQH